MSERGLEVDPTALDRWVQNDAPEMVKYLRYFCGPTLGDNWRVDEAYVTVKRSVDIFCIARSIQKEMRSIFFFHPPGKEGRQKVFRQGLTRA